MSQPTLTIQVNGQAFARAPRTRTGGSLTPLADTAGWYKPAARGVLLMEPAGSLFAFASRNDGGFIVSAHLYNGRVRYMFGLASTDEARLGVHTMRDSYELARSIFSQVDGVGARPGP